MGAYMIFSLSSREPCKVLFENRTGVEIAVYWASYSGCLHRYVRIAADASVEQHSYVGHPWSFAGFECDAPMVCQGRDVYYAEQGTCTCVVERPAVLEWSPSTHHKFPTEFRDLVIEVLRIYAAGRGAGRGAMDVPAVARMQAVPEEGPRPLTMSSKEAGPLAQMVPASFVQGFCSSGCEMDITAGPTPTPETGRCCLTAHAFPTEESRPLSVGMLQCLPPNCLEKILRQAAPKVDKMHVLLRRQGLNRDVVWRVERHPVGEEVPRGGVKGGLSVEEVLDPTRTRMVLEVDGEVIEGTLGERRYIVQCIDLINASRTEATRIDEVSTRRSQESAGRATIYVDTGRFPEPAFEGQRGVIVTAHRQDPIDQLNDDNTVNEVIEYGPLRDRDGVRLGGEVHSEGDDEDAARLDEADDEDMQDFDADVPFDSVEQSAIARGLQTLTATHLEDSIRGGNMPLPARPVSLWQRVLGRFSTGASEEGEEDGLVDPDDAEVEGFVDGSRSNSDAEESDFDSDEDEDPFEGPGSVRFVGGSMSLFIKESLIVLVYSTMDAPVSSRRQARIELQSATLEWAL